MLERNAASRSERPVMGRVKTFSEWLSENDMSMDEVLSEGEFAEFIVEGAFRSTRTGRQKSHWRSLCRKYLRTVNLRERYEAEVPVEQVGTRKLDPDKSEADAAYVRARQRRAEARRLCGKRET